MDSHLREQAWIGFRNRYGCSSQDMQAKAHRQIEKELALIEKLKLAGYFLIVWDLVRYCREQNILVQSVSSPKSAASGPTSISICPVATIAKKSSSISTKNMASVAPP